MTEGEPNRNELNEEFRNLGKNLIDSLKSIWDNPERIKLQQEVEEGLDTFASTIKQEAEKFRQSPTGQQLELELDDLNQRIKSGEAEQLARQEFIKVPIIPHVVRSHFDKFPIYYLILWRNPIAIIKFIH
jgi:hypothetical protein